MNKSYYAIIPANVRYDEDITPNAKLLYGEITALCNEKGYCWANNDYFAELYKASSRTVSRWIQQLISKGYISSKLIYREGTKEVQVRHIYIGSDKNDSTHRQKCHEGIDKNVHTPIDKNVQDNTTVINNTIINSTTCSDEKHLVVDTNKELIEKETHLILNSVHKLDKVRKMDKDRLIKAINIFKEKEGKYFSLLDKIYNDDGNFTKKEESQKSDPKEPNKSLSKNNKNIPIHTRFHNCNQTFNNYTEEELETLLLENQRNKFT